MNFRFAAALPAIFFLLTTCDQDPVNPQKSPPRLSKFSVPDTVFYNWEQQNIITVHCEDSDGLENIDSVYYQIFTLLDQKYKSGKFYNDGDYAAHGDILPNNNIFSARLNQTMQAGNYIIEAEAIDLSGEKSLALQDTFFAKAAILNHGPNITEYDIPDTVFIDQILPFTIQVRVTDPDSGDFVTIVEYEIEDPTLTFVAESGVLVDDGTSGDENASDLIFSRTSNSAFASWNYGIYYLFIEARDNRQNSSQTFSRLIFPAKKEIGSAPQISNLNAPLTFQIPSAGADSALITINATDPDDNRDIRSVFFNSYKPPDSTLSESSPLYLYDDGNSAGYSGDVLAGDNIYSIEIYIPAGSFPGEYRFEFEALDYSNFKSNKIIHRLTLVETK